MREIIKKEENSLCFSTFCTALSQIVGDVLNVLIKADINQLIVNDNSIFRNAIL